MNNKQLFEQSASKILSKNQLEGVMMLHNALFECGNDECIVETVADSVVDAVKDSVDEVVDQQVNNAVGNTNSIYVDQVDKVRLESLIDSMSDREKRMFLESLDDQQVQVLMEGFGSLARKFLNIFSKQGRKANRFDKWGRLAEKDAELTRKLDNLMDIDPTNLSRKQTKKYNQLIQDRHKVQQKMNDMRVNASGRQDEMDEMTMIGLDKGSRNFNIETMEKVKDNLQKNLDDKIKKAVAVKKTKMSELDKKYAQLDQKSPTYQEELKLLDAEKAKIEKNYNSAVKKAHAQYDNQINDYEYRINMAEKEAGYGGANRTYNTGRRGEQRQFNRFPDGHQFYQTPEAWRQFTRRYSTMHKVARGLVGSYKAFIAALKLGTFGALSYGGYKLYEIFSHPEEIDASNAIGGVDGNEDGSTVDTVKKVIAILGGGAAGNVAARFLGFDGTTGKTVSTLLGAALVAYFMFLNGGDENNAVEMLDEYNNASDLDKQVINETLMIDGLGDALQKIYDENHAQ